MPSDDYQFPASPPKESLDFLSSKEPKLSFDYRDVWREEHGFAFTVAKSANIDLLNDIQSALTDTLANGKTFQQFKKELTPILQQRGWWGKSEMVDPATGKLRTVQLGSPRRLKTIYNTNMRTAQAAGQWERIQNNKKFHPFLVYELGPSEHHRIQHQQWAGKILPVDDPFWATHMPPNGWNCKCHVRAMSAREVEREGGASESPPIIKKEWVNKRTGEIMDVPVGIDPGFDINPGIARAAHLQNVMTNKINSTKPAIAQATVRELVQSKPFAQFFAKPTGVWPIAALSAGLQNTLGATVNAVRLSDLTLREHIERHPDVTLDDYKKVPDIVDHGMVIHRTDGKLVFYYRQNGLYKMTVKVVGGKHELYMNTLYRTNEKERARDLRNGVVVREGTAEK